MPKKTPPMLRREEPHVVILGGGFAGLAAAKTLRNAAVRITLIDRSNHHLFQPLLYQVATAELAVTDVARPLRGIFARHPTVIVKQGEVTAVDVENRTVTTSQGEQYSGDYLVLAAGSKP